jgi:hypothetical protein
MRPREPVAGAPAVGIARVDLVRSDSEHKGRAMTGESQVSQGFVTRARRGGPCPARNSWVTAAKSPAPGPAPRSAVRGILRRRVRGEEP